jgi:hypothetical protein
VGHEYGQQSGMECASLAPHQRVSILSLFLIICYTYPNQAMPTTRRKGVRTVKGWRMCHVYIWMDPQPGWEDPWFPMTASFGPFESADGDHECWVPDQVGTISLMGRTWHRNYGPRPTKNWTLCMLTIDNLSVRYPKVLPLRWHIRWQFCPRTSLPLEKYLMGATAY